MQTMDYRWLKQDKIERSDSSAHRVTNKPPMIGSINCYCASSAKLGRKPFTFNGTTLDLVKRAMELGAKAGSVVHADYGAGMKRYVVYSNPIDQRANGFWVH